jgi:hypothetical protein
MAAKYRLTKIIQPAFGVLARRALGVNIVQSVDTVT